MLVLAILFLSVGPDLQFAIRAEAVLQKDTDLPNFLTLANCILKSLKDSSYEIDREGNFDLDTRLDKVFVLEDFRARLFVAHVQAQPTILHRQAADEHVVESLSRVAIR